MRILTIIIILSAILAGGAVGAETEYKKYTRAGEEKTLVELTVNPERWEFRVFDGDQEDIYSYETALVKQKEGRIVCGGEVILSDEGIEFPDKFINSDEIKRIDVRTGEETGTTILSFMAADDQGKTTKFKRKKSDRITFFGKTTVEEDQFIRGSVVSFFGDIDVYGEVNEDVVAVLGDVYVAGGAVVRGDVVAVNGKVKLADKSSVYGVIKSSDEKSSTRRHRARKWKSHYNTVSWAGSLYYNRVDGLTIWSGAEYEHSDSIIPSFEALAGYAFASERWRYRLGLTQTVIRGLVPVQVGGLLFRELKSDDDKLITESENTIFALLVNEDWKDYYEAEGGYGFARVKFLNFNRFEIGYLAEQQRWLDSHAHLWSLFGAKEFRGNFSSVPYDTLVDRKIDFNDRQITSLILRYDIDNLDNAKHPRRGWRGFASYEYSPGRWRGDFDFERFEARLKRFQPLGRYISVDLTAAYGYVDGDFIPLSRMFYLGGLGTLHGYRHKEFIGTEYFMVSSEYSFRIPHTDISPFVHYDGGRMMGDRMAGNDDWNGSIGVGVDIDRGFRIFLSKRLDEQDRDPVFYARFSAAVW